MKVVTRIRHVRSAKGAEGANLEQAKPGETLRQKDPVPKKLWKVPLRDETRVGYRRCNASLVEQSRFCRLVSKPKMRISQVKLQRRAINSCAFLIRQHPMESDSVAVAPWRHLLFDRRCRSKLLDSKTSKGATQHEYTSQFKVYKV